MLTASLTTRTLAWGNREQHVVLDWSQPNKGWGWFGLYLVSREILAMRRRGEIIGDLPVVPVEMNVDTGAWWCVRRTPVAPLIVAAFWLKNRVYWPWLARFLAWGMERDIIERPSEGVSIGPWWRYALRTFSLRPSIRLERRLRWELRHELRALRQAGERAMRMVAGPPRPRVEGLPTVEGLTVGDILGAIHRRLSQEPRPIAILVGLREWEMLLRHPSVILGTDSLSLFGLPLVCENVPRFLGYQLTEPTQETGDWTTGAVPFYPHQMPEGEASLDDEASGFRLNIALNRIRQSPWYQEAMQEAMQEAVLRQLGRTDPVLAHDIVLNGQGFNLGGGPAESLTMDHLWYARRFLSGWQP